MEMTEKTDGKRGSTVGLLSDGADSGDGAYAQYESWTRSVADYFTFVCGIAIWNRNFGDMTFVLYGIFVLIQAAIHLREGKSRTQPAYERCTAVSIEYCIYKISECIFSVHTVVRRMRTAASGLGRLGVLMLALIFTGIGAAMSLSMRLVPNPGDGLVQVLAPNTFESARV